MRELAAVRFTSFIFELAVRKDVEKAVGCYDVKNMFLGAKLLLFSQTPKSFPFFFMDPYLSVSLKMLLLMIYFSASAKSFPRLFTRPDGFLRQECDHQRSTSGRFVCEESPLVTVYSFHQRSCTFHKISCPLQAFSMFTIRYVIQSFPLDGF